MKKGIKKGWFVQSWGTYADQTLVVVGYTHDELLKITKNRFTPDVLKFLKEVKGDYDTANQGRGMCIFDDETNRSILYLREFHDTWEWYEVLLHECFHVVSFMAKAKNMKTEEEAQAYQLEYLFHNIRRSLQKSMGILK